MLKKVVRLLVVIAISSLANAGNIGIKATQFDGPFPTSRVFLASVSSNLPFDGPNPAPPIPGPPIG